MEENIVRLEESEPIKETKTRRNLGLGNWIKSQLFKIPGYLCKLFSLRTLVLLGVLLLLNKEGAFSDYPALQEATKLFADIINWFWSWIVNLI